MLPTYCAVIVGCDPTDRLVVVIVATPLAFSVLLPILELLSKKFTVPAGVPAAEVTVAVKTTDCPYNDGFGDEVTRVVVANVLVRAKVVVIAPRVLTVMAYVPAISFAQIFCEMTLSAIVNVMGVVWVILAPEVGAVKITCPPFTGSVLVLVTVKVSGFINAVLMNVL